MIKVPFTSLKEVVYHTAGEPFHTNDAGMIAAPGDFLLIKGKTNDLFSKLIRFGQGIRSNKKYADYTHAAVFVDNFGNLIEAEAQGVRTAHVSKYIEYDVMIIKINATDGDRTQAVAFAKVCENDGYGWATLFSIAVSLVTGLKFSFGFDGEEICSGLVASCLFMCGQWLSHDPSHVTPAILAQEYVGI